MLSLIENYLTDRMQPLPGGVEIIRDFHDEQKWISSNSRMSMPGLKGNLKQVNRTISIEPFYLLHIPVTTALYNFIAGNTAVFADNGIPVVNISWYDAVNFCNLLSLSTGLDCCYQIGDNPDDVS